MSHIETGNTKLSLPVLVQLSKALDLRADDLLFESIHSRSTDILKETAELLGNCTPQQFCFMKELIQAAQLSMNKYLL